jgi:hypothetical protein
LDLVERLRRKAPAYLDLITAANDIEFDAALDALLGTAVAHLERNKANFKSLDEVGLSAVLAAGLTVPGVVVTQEAHSNGHVDLTIEVLYCTPMRRSLGEAKIYHGPKYHIQGLQQLLGRYTTGREGRGLVVVYVRVPDIAGLFRKLRAAMDKERPMGQLGDTQDHTLKWSFISKHEHSSGDNCHVGHVGCNLHVASDAKS